MILTYTKKKPITHRVLKKLQKKNNETRSRILNLHYRRLREKLEIGL